MLHPASLRFNQFLCYDDVDVNLCLDLLTAAASSPSPLVAAVVRQADVDDDCIHAYGMLNKRNVFLRWFYIA